MLLPQKLKKGDTIRIIAPSSSALMIGNRHIGNAKLASLGLNLTFGKHIEESDDFGSTTIEARIKDLHDAFADPEVKAVHTVIGGFNSNQLLPYIDYDLIANNPKIFCGYSDITALSNAITAKTGMVTYSGPHYSSFCMKKGVDYITDYFQKCLFSNDPYEIVSSEYWAHDEWYLDQENRDFKKNEGYWILQKGKAQGTSVGGNLCTFKLLHGTPYMPDLKNTILFIEDDPMNIPEVIDRDFQSLIHQPGFDKVKGIVVGRFHPDGKMTRKLLEQIVRTKKELSHLPIIANVDFGHTTPMITFPIGGEVSIDATGTTPKILVGKH